MKRFLAKIAFRVERFVDRFRAAKRAEFIAPYIGYATPEHLMVRGRVLSSLRKDAVTETQSKWTNLRQMVQLFMTEEVADVAVTAQGVMVRSDEEGYFSIPLPRGSEEGQVDVAVSAGVVTAECPVVIPARDAAFGVISDIDDTMMETGAYSLWRNLWTSLTGNALTRKVFLDAVELMQMLHQDGANPVFFVSSSPWNLHAFLDQIFARHGLPFAPKFLRDYGISETQFITGTHGDHKGDAIDRILAANPHLPFILIGDTGQHDAHVYRDVIKRHLGRITHVVLRAPGAGADEEDLTYINAIRDLGVPAIVGADYTEAIATLRPQA